MFPWTLAISCPEAFSIHHWDPISWRIFFLITACNWFWELYISNVGRMAMTLPWISPRRVPSVASYQNFGPKLTSCCLTYASRFPLVSLIPKVSRMASIFWSIMYCVPLNGVFHPGVWPKLWGLVAWRDMGAPHRPQKRLPGTSGWPQEVQTGLVINWNPSAVGCSGSKRELCLLKRQRREALMRREVDSLRPPIFPGTFPVWQ